MSGRIKFIIGAVFSRLKFRYKLTAYFTLFGLFIGHLSFIFYTTIATNNLKHIVSAVVTDWLENNGLPDDAIESYIGRPYDGQMNTAFPFISVFKDEFIHDHQKNKLDLYYFSKKETKWFKLYRDHHGYVAKSGIGSDEESEIVSFMKKGTLSTSYSPFYGKSDNVYFWLNLTRPGDKNVYIARIVSDRKGVFTFIGGKEILLLYTLFVFFISLIFSRLIALHISKPVSRLSLQTAGIASGNLDIRTKIISNDEFGELSGSINRMADKIREHQESMQKRMETISVMNKIDKAVLSSISRHDLIDRVTFIVSDLFSDCMVALAMTDLEKEKYVILSHYMKRIKRDHDDGLGLSFKKLTAENLESNKSFFILSMNSDNENLSYLNSIIHENFLHMMNLPIWLDEEYIGSLIIGKDTDSPFTAFETDTLKALADQTGVAMKSVKFFEEKEKLFLGILMALSKTIDAKSKWTAGHSGRVAVYSEKLAVMMGMDNVFLNDLKVSANLHDIGKIGVPETVLDKPGELNNAEFEIIRKHPLDGASIIEQIPGYEKFINGIIFHHEAWDGSGYPYGLKGREIPLMGRLIAVADVYDSLTSDRPYRNSMTVDDASAILIAEKGKKLDPFIVDMMIEIIKSEKIQNRV